MTKIILIIYLALFNVLLAEENISLPILSIESDYRNEAVITVSRQSHIDYGLSYPITYEFTIPQNSTSLYAFRKHSTNEEWHAIDIKTSDDFFNGIEAVRFNYFNNTAYISTAFSSISDSIYIKITNSDYNNVSASFSKISKYYDNRDAAVTITADDWAGWNNQNFIETCENFRSLNLWLSCAVITDISDQLVWDNIQEQLNLGFIEVVSHSRTHPYIPYQFIESEVLGSKQDLIENLDLPELSKYGIREYIYAWVAPYGEYDQDIDTLVSFGKYLTSRLFYWGDNQFSDWDNMLNKFFPVGASIEMGSSSYWGSTDIVELNNTFDNVIALDGIYHLMTHPNILEWDQDFTWNHLEYISNRKNMWYVGFGHLYLYRFLSNSNQGINLNVKNISSPASNFKLHKNYPNPFNPITSIRYDLLLNSPVEIKIYNLLGNKVRNLINEFQNSGNKIVDWDATNNDGESVPAGIYLYSVLVNDQRKTGKMIYLK